MNGIPEAKMSDDVLSANHSILTEKEKKNEIPAGYCQCGCGKKTKLITHTNIKDGRIKGEPSRFLSGHNGRLESNIMKSEQFSKKGKESFSWKGGKTIDSYGYALAYNPDNGKAANYTRVHILMAEKVLGRKLPKGVVIHHVDENRLHNENSNFVICENQGYHNLIHKRMRALAAGGVHMVRCPICKEHDIPENLYIRSNGQGFHRECHAKAKRDRKRIKRENASNNN